MKTIFALLKVRFLTLKRGAVGLSARNRRFRLLLLGSLGFFFWIGSFLIFYRILKHFRSVEVFGDILAFKLLSMVLMTFFCLLIFSAVITSLAKLFLSQDLMLLHSFPIERVKLFLVRYVESTWDSSWMVVLYSLPVFLSYGIIYNADAFFYVVSLLVILAICLLASTVSHLFSLLAAFVLPAGRLRSLFVFIGTVLFIILIVTFRLMRPEQLVNPDAFQNILHYFRALTLPSSPLLPTSWLTDALKAALNHHPSVTYLNMALSFSLVSFLLYLSLWLADKFYFRGFSKNQTATKKLITPKGSPHFLPLRKRKDPVTVLFHKELKMFFRDHTQWPQLFLLSALILVYLYNFSVLPPAHSSLETLYLKNVLAFLNLGLTAFVLTAIAARFAFPAISTEGEAFWVIKVAPLPLRTFLWIKFLFYLIPLMLLAEILILATNVLLGVDNFMMVLSLTTITLTTPGIVALAIGLGAAYADFQAENPAQSATSFGGLLYMLLSVCFIGLVIVLEAGPVYRWTTAGLKKEILTIPDWLWFFSTFLVVLVSSILAVIFPIRHGITALSRQ